MKQKIANHSTFIQLLEYGIVGGIAFVADYGSLWCLTEYAHVHHLVSAALAFIIGLAVNYLLSIRWVFKERAYDNKWMEFAIFAIIGVIGLGFNELIIYVVTDLMTLHYMLGKIVSTIIVFFWNFFARKIVLFRKKSNQVKLK